MALQVGVSTARSPSPVVPGAWPSSSGASSPIRTRSLTCPVVTSSQRLQSTASLTDPLHLEHVRNFHQHLSRSLFQAEPCHVDQALVATDRLPISSEINTIPSDGSDMTRFTLGDMSASLSVCADTSRDTAWSSEGNAAQDKLLADPRANSLAEQGVPEPNLLLAHDPVPTTQQSVTDSSCFPRPQHRRMTISLSPSPSWCPLPSPDPVSPILFASPASPASPVSSNHALHPRSSFNVGDISQTLEYFGSPSWETCGSFVSDDDLPRIYPSGSLTRPISMCRDRLEQDCRGYSQARTPANANPPVEMEAGADPKLIKSSPSGTAETSLDTGREDRGASQATGTIHQTFSIPVSPQQSQGSPVLSLLPPSPALSESDRRASVRILAFPSPTNSLSPFIPGLPSPTLESSLVESSTADSSTVEYAAAVVSSVFGGDISSVLEGDMSIYADYPGLLPVPDTRASLSDLRIEHDQTLAEKRRSKYMITKIKDFGQQVKKYISGKGRKLGRGEAHKKSKPYVDDMDNGTQRPSRSSGGASNSPTQYVDGLPDHDDVLIEEDGSICLPAPPGLMPPHTRKPRPSLTAHTYNSTGSESIHTAAKNFTGSGSTLPTIRITSSSFSDNAVPPRLPTGRNSSPHSVDYTQALRPEARPKTLAEIKSKRRISLSALSHVNNSAIPSTSSLVAVTRPGPATIRPFASSHASLMSEQGESRNGRRTDGQAAMLANMGQESENLHLDARASTSRSSANGQRHSFCMTPGPLENLARIKKKHRRFSLSTLSTLLNHSNSMSPA